MADSVRVHGRELLFVLVLVVLAFALRAFGTEFGLPHTYHPDEHQYVETALDVLGGDPHPHRFNNPALYKYTLALIDGAWYVAARAAGDEISLDGFVARAAEDPATAYLLARVVTALLGALTVAVTYLLARLAYGRREAAIAAVLIAGTFLHVRQSHFAVSDVPATFLTTLALVGCVLVLTRTRTRDYVVAGVMIGAATATKYSSLAAAFPLVLAHVAAEGSARGTWLRRLVDRRLIGAGLTAAAVFVLAAPFSVIDRAAFYTDVALLYERGQSGFKGLRLAEEGGWIFYLKTLRWGMGLPFLAFSLVSVLAALVRHRRADVVLASFPLLLYVYLGRQLLLFERFVLPALPVLAVLAAALLWQVLDRTQWSSRGKSLAAAAVVCVLLVRPVTDSLRFDWLLTQADTRDLAQAWIEANVPEGTRIVAHANGPQLAGGDRASPGAGRTFDVTYVGTTSLGDEPVQALRDAGHELVVVSSYSYDRRMLDEGEDARRQDFYRELDERAVLVHEVTPHIGDAPIPFVFAHVYGPATDLWKLRRPGPTVKVYALDLPTP